ncbi:MAG: hypothetical protein OHK0023_12360 [Anaerolineae bacterium]
MLMTREDEIAIPFPQSPEQLIARIAARLVGISSDRVDDHIIYALAQLAEFIEANRAGVVDASLPPAEARIYAWTDELVAASPEPGYDFNFIAWYGAVLQGRDAFILNDIQELPDDEPVLTALRRRGIQSLLVIPITFDQERYGYIYFDSVGQPRSWDTTKVATLRIAADIVASTIARVSMEQALRKQESHFRLIISSLPVSLFAIDLNGTLTVAEGSIIHPIGDFQLSQLLGMNVFTDFPQFPAIAHAARRTLRGESSSDILEYAPNHYSELHFAPIRDSRANIVGASATVYDVTERIRALQIAQNEKLLLEALTRTATALTSSLNQDEVMECILKSVAQVVPHDAGTIMVLEQGRGRVTYTQGHYQLTGTKDSFKELAFPSEIFTLRRMLDTGEPVLISQTEHEPEWRHYEPTSWVKSYLGMPMKINGQVVGFLNLDSATPGFFTQDHVDRLHTFAAQAAIALRNATLFAEVQSQAQNLERRVLERTADLEEERARLNAILDGMSDGVAFVQGVNPTRITYVNKAFLSLVGYSEAELIGADAAIIYHLLLNSDPNFAKHRQHVIDTLSQNGTYREECRIRKKDGAFFDAQIVMNTVSNRPGKSVGVVALIRDISHEKQLQERRDRFISNASHELRTPLTNMKMRLYLMRRQPERIEEHLRVLEHVTTRMQALVEDLLDISRFERGGVPISRERIMLQPLIEDVVSLQSPHAEERKIKLKVALEPSPIYLYADADRLTQVITNLVVNALNYTHEQGTVSLEAFTEANWAILRVTDNGIGIAPHLLQQIFEPFFRVNLGAARGTGLGLTISREIVRLHGGDIEAQSEEGRGTTMLVRLPLLPE